jgi:hypothetical protein
MAKASAKNTRSVTTIQEATYVPARYIENSDAPERPQRVTATDREKHLNHLQETLCTIAKDLNLTDPELQAHAIRIKLVRRIDYHRSSLARDLLTAVSLMKTAILASTISLDSQVSN